MILNFIKAMATIASVNMCFAVAKLMGAFSWQDERDKSIIAGFFAVIIALITDTVLIWL